MLTYIEFKERGDGKIVLKMKVDQNNQAQGFPASI